MPRRKKKQQKPIAFVPGTKAKENLPLPIVCYSGFYGHFLGFQSEASGGISLCECSRTALANYLKFRVMFKIPNSSDSTRSFILDAQCFPLELVQNLMEHGISDPEQILEAIEFKEHICHRCNKSVPSLRYCHEMYGGTFKQNFGWYIGNKLLEYGVMPIHLWILKEVCPQEILDAVTFDREQMLLNRQKIVLEDRAAANDMDKRITEQYRSIWNIAENAVREEFGHKEIGSQWTSETVLAGIVRSIFPDLEVVRHYRPTFLKGLELDIWVDDLKLGIEFQGIQHYEPVEHWGGKKALKELKKRDERKRQLCKENEINLVAIDFTEPLSATFVKSRLREVGILTEKE